MNLYECAVKTRGYFAKTLLPLREIVNATSPGGEMIDSALSEPKQDKATQAGNQMTRNELTPHIITLRGHEVFIFPVRMGRIASAI